MSLKITKSEKQIFVVSEYSPDLPKRAKLISGRWNATNRSWDFPIEALEQVKELYLDIYGEWEDEPLETVNIICEVDEQYGEYCQGISLHGRVIANASGRDSGAKTANGIIVLKGGFTSGGSVKNWKTICKEGTIFKILNVPMKKAIDMVEIGCSWAGCKIEEKKTIDKEELTKERERLMQRIEEIDKLLK